MNYASYMLKLYQIFQDLSYTSRCWKCKRFIL